MRTVAVITAALLGLGASAAAQPADAFGDGSVVTIGPRLTVPFGPGVDRPFERAEIRFGARWAPSHLAGADRQVDLVGLGWGADGAMHTYAFGAPITGPGWVYADGTEGKETTNRGNTGLIVAGAALATGGAVLLLTELWDEVKDTSYCAGEIIVESVNDDPPSCAR